jgi:hypothetical protein
MAARRLLIVLVILLGLSTLAAALVPQRTLRNGTTTGTTTTQATTSTPERAPGTAYLKPTKITVGGKKFPVVAPVPVGEQLTLLVRSRFPAQIEIPEFGLIRFATPGTPARFELLADTPGTFGILFGASPKQGVTGKPAARIVVVSPAATKKAKKSKEKQEAKKSGQPKGSARSRAPEGSDPA